MKRSSRRSEAEFTPNRHLLLASFVLVVLTLGLIIYDATSGEGIFSHTFRSALDLPGQQVLHASTGR